MFYVGQKVCCVDDGPSWTNGSITAHGPDFKEVVTIRGITSIYGEVGLVFEEYRNPEREFDNGVYEPHFSAIHFKPVTDISDLKSIVREVLDHQPHRDLTQDNPLDRRKVDA